jgi:hypothetical protein
MIMKIGYRKAYLHIIWVLNLPDQVVQFIFLSLVALGVKIKLWLIKVVVQTESIMILILFKNLPFVILFETR